MWRCVDSAAWLAWHRYVAQGSHDAPVPAGALLSISAPMPASVVMTFVQSRGQWNAKIRERTHRLLRNRRRRHSLAAGAPCDARRTPRAIPPLISAARTRALHSRPRAMQTPDQLRFAGCSQSAPAKRFSCGQSLKPTHFNRCRKLISALSGRTDLRLSGPGNCELVAANTW